MTATAEITDIKKEVIRVPHREGNTITHWTLDGYMTFPGEERRYVRSWEPGEEAEAKAALDRIAYDYLCSSAAAPVAADSGEPADPQVGDGVDGLAVDPLDPFNGKSGGPSADPLLRPTSAQLKAAVALILETYPDDTAALAQKKGQRVSGIGGGVRRAVTALSERTWWIQEDGSLVIEGSTADEYYLVADETCHRVYHAPDVGPYQDPAAWVAVYSSNAKGRQTQKICQGYFNHGRCCYHAIAREVLRLAQLTGAVESLAYVDAALFGGACFPLFRTQAAVQFALDGERLVLQAGALRQELPLIAESFGVAAITISSMAFAAFWKDLTPVVRQLMAMADQVEAQVWLTPADGAVTIIIPATDFSYTIAPMVSEESHTQRLAA